MRKAVKEFPFEDRREAYEEKKNLLRGKNFEW